MKNLFKKVSLQTTNMTPDPDQDSKKAVWKFIIQTVINILAAVLTALGATSCVGLFF
jgi:hypothetical protein